jgi:hypothetical protein
MDTTDTYAWVDDVLERRRLAALHRANARTRARARHRRVNPWSTALARVLLAVSIAILGVVVMEMGIKVTSSRIHADAGPTTAVPATATLVLLA